MKICFRRCLKMCYLIAKEFDRQGCIAVKTRHGKELSNMVDELNKEVSDKGVQLVTISRPSAYGEYELYEIFDNVEDFKDRVKKLL